MVPFPLQHCLSKECQPSVWYRVQVVIAIVPAKYLLVAAQRFTVRHLYTVSHQLPLEEPLRLGSAEG